MAIDIAQVVISASVSLVVGGLSAWFAGALGIRHGLQRAKREKAFELSLEWYKRTVQTLHRFVDSAVRMPGSMFIQTAGSADSVRRLEKTTSDLITSLAESALFAERATARELRDVIIDLESVKIGLAEKPSSVTPGLSDLWKEVMSLTKDLRVLEILLSNFVRKELNLDQISVDDLKSTYEKEEQELKKTGV